MKQKDKQEINGDAYICVQQGGKTQWCTLSGANITQKYKETPIILFELFSVRVKITFNLCKWTMSNYKNENQ